MGSPKANCAVNPGEFFAGSDFGASHGCAASLRHKCNRLTLVMKTTLRTIQLLTLLAASASAQLVPDGGTATINGVTTNLAGSLTVGTNSGNTTLILTNGGQVNSDGGTIGSGAGSSSNIVFITGPGSVWSNYPNAGVRLGVSGAGNRLIVTNGGALLSTLLRFGSGDESSSNNSMVVTGPGSEVRSRDLFMGLLGARNQLTIENGARVNADYVAIGSNSGPPSTNNTLRVTDGGLLLITNSLEIGGLSRNNQLIIANGGKVTNDSCVIGGGLTFGLSASNTVTVTGAGSVWHCRTGLVVGVLGFASQVVISDSGLLRTDNGYSIGSSSNGNSVIVSGAGSVWSMGVAAEEPYVGDAGSDNQLIVTNGGCVKSESNFPITIGATSGSNNVIRVTGPGSLLLTTNGNSPINLGGTGSSVATRSRLVVENGGQAFFRTITIGPGGGSSNHEVSVSGPGSLLSAGLFRVALGSSGNHLSISNGGMVIAQNLLFVGNGSASGQLTVSDASLIVTNAAGNNTLRMNRGTNIFDGGTIVTDRLELTNGVVGALLFKRGTLRSASTAVANGLPFVVGDGVNAATLQVPGGIHTFSNGLIISSNAILQGCGTFSGDVIVQPGGTVLSDCTNLVFSGTVTNHGTLRALNGSTLRAQGLIVNQGVIDIIEGTTNFLGGFINNGIVLTPANLRISGVSITGYDVAVKLPSFSGHTFQLQRRDLLTIGSWADLGAAQTGTGGILTFTNTGSLTNAPERFYRIRVVP